MPETVSCDRRRNAAAATGSLVSDAVADSVDRVRAEFHHRAGIADLLSESATV